MRKTNERNRRRTWRPKGRRRAPVVSGKIQMPEKPSRWELDLIVGSLVEVLENLHGAADVDAET